MRLNKIGCLIDLAAQQLAEELHKPIIKNFKEQFLQNLKTILGVLI